jgi:hypothetical protein
VVKVIAIFLLIDMLSVLAQVAGWIGFTITNPSAEDTVFSILMAAFVLVILGLILQFFFLSTDKVVDKLRLDRHFQEETFQLNIHQSTVIKIATIVVGALLFADALPYLFKYAISYKRSSELGDRPEDYSTLTWFLFYAIKLLIGYLLFTNSSRVAAIIEKKRRS